MDIRRFALILVASVIITSCSKKSPDDKQSEVKRESGSVVAKEEDEPQPHDDEIEEHCVAFVRSTKVVSAQTPAAAACSGCPPAGAEVFAFRHMKTDRISCSADTCTVLVTIRVSFNPGAGERMDGGLTAWIPPEQRNAYLKGETPPGEQAYRVQITYKHRGGEWRAIEFDRAPAE